MSLNPPAPVLIIGGGPIGLAAAVELARFHVPSVVLEQRETTSWHPKTRNLSTRAMEIAHGWGPVAYNRLRAIDIPDGWKSPIRFLETVVGTQFGEIESAGFAGPGPEISPARPIMSAQDHVERILLDTAAATGEVSLRFGHQVTRVLAGQHRGDTEVAVEVTDGTSGATHTISGSALVAADGSDSLVRQHLGVRLDGALAVHRFVNCYFRADIEPHVGERSGVLLYIHNGNASGVLQPLDAKGRWLCQIPAPSDEMLGSDACRQWIRDAVGVADLDIEVLSVGRWQMNAAVAENFVMGRTVLCGDAAHQFPPTGGLGVNAGLQGVHNAMWKLALCVRGLAEWSLLDTYDAEHRLPAKRATEQSLENFRNLGRIVTAYTTGTEQGLGTANAIRGAYRYGNHFGFEFGTVHASTAIIADGTPPADVGDSYTDYRQSATPGCRAPHVWLGSHGGALSTLDLFGAGFTVLTGLDGVVWRRAAEVASRIHGVAVASYAIGDPGIEDHEGTFFDRYGIASDGAVLVRPDGYVGWRSAGGPVGDGEALVQALGRILGRHRG